MKAEIIIEEHECPVCFVYFAAPERLFASKRKHGDPFFCPNGHQLSYTDSEHSKLIRERDLLKQRLAEKDDRIDDLIRKGAVATAEARRLATRASHGVCPCCHRTFSQLARHMKSKHPEFKALKAVS